MIEEVSVLAADRRRKEPRIIPRPGQEKKKAKGGTRRPEGARSMLEMARQRIADGAAQAVSAGV